MLMAALLAVGAMDDGRELTRQFFAGETAAVWERMTPRMQGAIGSAEKLAAFREKVRSDAGEETALIEEKTETEQGMQIYRRVARFSKAPVEVRWVFDGAGKVAGFWIRPALVEDAPTKFLDYQTKTPLRLPFEGKWLVFWGGKTVAQNYHAAVRDQRFAYDLIVAHGESKRLEDFPAFGKPILAPGEGVVVAAVDGLPDQAPGQMDPQHAMGNHVVLDHGNGEYSFLCHLKKGSVKVKAGERVKAGQVVGSCGNSGNTSEPHLHYHLQNSPRPFDGDGLPAQFLNYAADGKPVERGIPVKGEQIEAR